jgi:hypothetical protein
MSAAPLRPARHRPRRGSPERPLSARTYRGTWLLVSLPLLVAAFTVARPAPIPQPELPPAFDGESAATLAAELAQKHPDRSAGSAGAEGAVGWLLGQLRPYGFRPRVERFTADVPGRGRVKLANVVATAPGRSSETIVVMAHRDNTGIDEGANDNASGTGALLELARAYANPAAGSATPSTLTRARPAHTIVFLSTDGGVLGGGGARWFARHSPIAEHAVAVVNLDSIGGRDEPRIEFAGDRPRSPSPTLVATAAARVGEQSGELPERPDWLHQLVDLAFPFSFYEHAPLVGSGVSAVTLTSAGDRPPLAFGDTVDSLNVQRLGEIGRSAQQLLASLDDSGERAESTSAYVYLGSRLIRGWTIELVLITALLPFLAAVVDLFALCLRRRIPLAPALRSYRSRFAFWLWLLLVFEALRLLGVLPHGDPLPPPPEESAGTEWPIAALLILLALGALGWFIARDRLMPRRAVGDEEVLAGQVAALLVLAVVSLIVLALNPFSLLILLPALHAWLWLPQSRRGSLAHWLTLVVGYAGIALLLSSFALRLDLGLDAVWYLASLAAIGYIPFSVLLVAVGFAAAAAQLSAVGAGRYAPYPPRRERPPLGPIRRVLRRIVVAKRSRPARQTLFDGEDAAVG